jgi:hypothetical protein
MSCGNFVCVCGQNVWKLLVWKFWVCLSTNHLRASKSFLFYWNMSSIIFQYFNYSTNPKLTMPLCLMSNSTMFPTSYNLFSGLKSPLNGTWLPKFVINPLENMDAKEMENLLVNLNALDMQNFVCHNFNLNSILNSHLS